jgi:hypothetical protein
MSEYTITKIESGIATVTYADGSYAHIVMKDSMTEDDFDALAFDFAPKTGSVPSFATEGAKRNTKERVNDSSNDGVWTQDRIDKLNPDEISKFARDERNIRLGNSDWVALKALESGSAVPDKWKTYRQELRDLPAAGTSKWNPSIVLDTSKDEDGIKINGITWPTEPS